MEEGLRKIEGKGTARIWSDRPLLAVPRRAGTAGPSERKVVVFGHAYAIPAQTTASGGGCGKDEPIHSANDVLVPTPGPGRVQRRGPRHVKRRSARKETMDTRHEKHDGRHTDAEGTPDSSAAEKPAADQPVADKFDDEDYPAYTMGRAAEMLGTTPGFLRSLDEAKLFTPQRSAGGHRRYSRYQLRLAARARDLVDHGTPIEAACRIIILEDQLEEAQRINIQLRHNH